MAMKTRLLCGLAILMAGIALATSSKVADKSGLASRLVSKPSLAVREVKRLVKPRLSFLEEELRERLQNAVSAAVTNVESRFPIHSGFNSVKEMRRRLLPAHAPSNTPSGAGQLRANHFDCDAFKTDAAAVLATSAADEEGCSPDTTELVAPTVAEANAVLTKMCTGCGADSFMAQLNQMLDKYDSMTGADFGDCKAPNPDAGEPGEPDMIPAEVFLQMGTIFRLVCSSKDGNDYCSALMAGLGVDESDDGDGPGLSPAMLDTMCGGCKEFYMSVSGEGPDEMTCSKDPATNEYCVVQMVEQAQSYDGSDSFNSALYCGTCGQTMIAMSGGEAGEIMDMLPMMCLKDTDGAYCMEKMEELGGTLVGGDDGMSVAQLDAMCGPCGRAIMEMFGSLFSMLAGGLVGGDSYSYGYDSDYYNGYGIDWDSDDYVPYTTWGSLSSMGLSVISMECQGSASDGVTAYNLCAEGKAPAEEDDVSQWCAYAEALSSCLPDCACADQSEDSGWDMWSNFTFSDMDGRRCNLQCGTPGRRSEIPAAISKMEPRAKDIARRARLQEQSQQLQQRLQQKQRREEVDVGAMLGQMMNMMCISDGTQYCMLDPNVQEFSDKYLGEDEDEPLMGASAAKAQEGSEAFCSNTCLNLMMPAMATIVPGGVSPETDAMLAMFQSGCYKDNNDYCLGKFMQDMETFQLPSGCNGAGNTCPSSCQTAVSAAAAAFGCCFTEALALAPADSLHAKAAACSGLADECGGGGDIKFDILVDNLKYSWFTSNWQTRGMKDAIGGDVGRAVKVSRDLVKMEGVKKNAANGGSTISLLVTVQTALQAKAAYAAIAGAGRRAGLNIELTSLATAVPSEALVDPTKSLKAETDTASIVTSGVVSDVAASAAFLGAPRLLLLLLAAGVVALIHAEAPTGASA